MVIIQDEKLLRLPCRTVSVSQGLKTGRKLLHSLLSFNRKNKLQGVGLSAPQIGIYEKVCVLLIPKQIVLVNPVIVDHSYKQLPFVEGCLSFGSKTVNTFRWTWVRVQADNIKQELFFGEQFIDSVVCQHECDHLNQILFIDRTTDLTTCYEGFRLGMTNQEGNSNEVT